MINKKYSGIIAFVQLILFISLFLSCSTEEKSNAEKQTKKINWLYNIKKAKQLAKTQNKPLMIDFSAEWCPPCNRMKDSTFSDQKVIEKSKYFIPVKIDVDKQGLIADKYKSNASKYGGIGIPNILFISPDSVELAHPRGYKDPKEFISVMDSVLIKIKKIQ